MIEPLWATQFSLSVWCVGSLKKVWPFSWPFSTVATRLAPQLAGSSARHRAPMPPPHSSVKTILSPALLKMAECQ